MTSGGKKKTNKAMAIWSKKSFRVPFIICSSLIVGAALLIIGVNIGNGNIAFGNSSLTGLPPRLNYSSVNQVYTALRENFDGKLSEEQVLNGIKTGLAASANDPYTEFFTPAEAKSFNQQLNNQFSGIGAELGEDSSGDIQIIAPIVGTPAAKAGLQAQDIIASINGTSTSGMTVDQAVDLIRGKAGTKVSLGVIRGNQQLTIDITRENLSIPSVSTKIINGDIGYMQITTFADDTAALVQKDAQAFANEHVKGIVLDLRNNPGGLLTAAVTVSSQWVPSGQQVLTERAGGAIIQTYNAEGGDVLHGIPTVVLINSGSASASEITTGALHDNKEAYVIGTKSYGKGVVQQLINFNDGSQLKVTVASWYRPNGQNINHKGITPDQTVNQPATETFSSNDPQLNAALSYLSSHTAN